MTETLRRIPHRTMLALSALAVLTVIPPSNDGQSGYGVAQADVLILRATGPEAPRRYRRGARLAETETIRLDNNETLTVLTRTGSRRFSGPGLFNLNRRSSIATGDFWPAANTENARIASGRGRPAVARGEPPLPPMPIEAGAEPDDSGPTAEEMEEKPANDILQPFAEFWQVDLSEGGRFCYFSSHLIEPRFTGDGDDTVGYIQLRAAGDEDAPTRRLAYHTGYLTVPNRGALVHWPEDWSLEDGMEYAAALDEPGADPVVTEFIQLETIPFENLDPTLPPAEFLQQLPARYRALQAEMDERGCTRQQELLARALSETNEEDEAAESASD